MPAPSQRIPMHKHLRAKKGIILLALLILVSVSVVYIVLHEESRMNESMTGRVVGLEDQGNATIPQPLQDQSAAKSSYQDIAVVP